MVQNVSQENDCIMNTSKVLPIMEFQIAHLK